MYSKLCSFCLQKNKNHLDLQLLPTYVTLFFFNVAKYLTNQFKEGRVGFGWQFV